MSNETTNPSTETAGSDKQGVFEGIRGEKSRDQESETVLTAEKESAARASGEQDAPAKTEPQKAEREGDNETEVALRQRTAKLERQIAEMGPWAQIGVQLRQSPGGEDLVQKLQSGESLTSGEQAQVREAGDEAGLTKKELLETLNMRDAAKQQIDEIHSMARENFSDYDKIRKSPQFLGMVDASLGAVWNGSIPLHPSTKDWTVVQAASNYTAIASAHELYVMRNPKVKEALKAAGKKEADDRNADKLAASSMSSGTSTSASDEKDMTTEERIKHSMLNARGVGKSFAKMGRTFK